MNIIKPSLFIERAHKKFGNKYDYSKGNYIDSKTPMTIICPKHGLFELKPGDHLRSKYGCPKCSLELRSKNTSNEMLDIFKHKGEQIHNFKYDYSKVKYVNSNTPVTIICPIHGKFKLKPSIHLLGKGCPKCGFEKMTQNKLTRDEFILKAILVHGNKYDYSKVDYVNNKTKVCIICPEHGEFWLIPSSHLSGNGCPKCGYETIKSKLRLSQNDFIERSKKVHNNYYDYSKTEYIDTNHKVTIICPTHGEFLLFPESHLHGLGCPKCGNIKKSISNKDTTKSFIKKAKKVHGDKYNYKRVKYIDSKTKVCIICPEHGEFWLTPADHLLKRGCPICKSSHGENLIFNILNLLLIKSICQYKITDVNFTKSCMYVDFYLPDYNIFIEYNGKQHYEPIKYFGGELRFEHLKLRDTELQEYCNRNNIKLLSIDYNKTDDEITNIIKQIKYV